MQEISLMYENGLPRFLEAFIDHNFHKTNFDSLKLRNGLLDAIPGVIWQDRFGQVWGKESDEKHVAAAFIGFVCTSAYAQALIRYNLNKTVEGKVYYEFATALKKLIDETNVYIESFDPDQFWGRATFPYLELFKEFGEQIKIPENQRINIQKYVRDYARILLIDFCRHNIPPSSILGIITSDRQLVEGDLRKQEYLIRLKNEYTDLTLNDENGMTLDAIYQEPGFRIFEKCLKEGEYKKDRRAFVKSSEVGLDQHIHEFTNQWFIGKISCDALRPTQSRLLLLYGYPGQGKTSFCKRLVYDLLGDQPMYKEVYMVRLRNIADPQNLKSEVLETISAYFKKHFDFSPSRLEESILILDGLDELLMKNKLKSEDVEEIFQNIRNSLRVNEDLKIIVTSRFGYLNLERLSATSILILQLEELDVVKQEQWLEKYLQFHDTWLTAEKLREINESGSHLKELVGQPILLHLVATLDQGLEEDVNRAKVYERLFDQITDPVKWKKDQIALLEGLESEDLRKALQEMAYEIWRSGDGYIHKSAIRELRSIQDIENKLRGGGQFQDVLKVMMVAFYFQEVAKQQSAVLSEDTNHYAVEFLHKSLQEYLAAEYIWFEMLEGFLAPGVRKKYALDEDGKALEVVQEIFGIQAMSNEILEYLVEIIKNYPMQVQKDELAGRIDYFFDYFLRKDFLHSYDATQMDHPFQIGTWIGHGVWTIFSHLQSEKNRFSDEGRRELFAAFLRSRVKGHLINLRGADLSGADLMGADLSRAILRGADLSGAILSGAYFNGADLIGAILRGAILRGADISGAILIGADLRGADLRGAYLNGNFSNADLRGADLRGAKFSIVLLESADLRGADLSGASLGTAIFRNADLSGADLRGADFITDLPSFVGGADFNGAKLSEIRNATPQQFVSVGGLEESYGLSEDFISKILALRAEEAKESDREEEE